MKYTILFLLIFPILLNAEYKNCNFKNEHYIHICKKVVKNGVSFDYANRFLLDYFKTQKFDEISWKYIQPSKIKYHRKREKQANNVLISYIPKLKKHLKKYKSVYDIAEKKYHVNREVISAILLKETKLGDIKPTHDAFIVFNTLLTRLKPKTNRDKRLINMSKTNMVSIIKHCYKAKLNPNECNLPSSYAGAVGIPQFMPNSFIFGESYKNKVVNLNDMQDAILSVAKFLNKKAKFKTLIDWSKFSDIANIERDWYEYDFKYKNVSFVYEKSKNGKEFNCFTKNKPNLVYIKNYVKKIMSYNNSSNYAIGVLRLAYEATPLASKPTLNYH